MLYRDYWFFAQSSKGASIAAPGLKLASVGGYVVLAPRMANAVPITYEGKNGKQYVAVTASDTVVVFALP